MSAAAAAAYVDRFRVAAPTATDRAASLAVAGVFGTLHALTYVWFDQYFDLTAILKDIVKRPFIMMGAAAFVLMVPLAITSTQGMIRRLGRQWGRLHRLV